MRNIFILILTCHFLCCSISLFFFYSSTVFKVVSERSGIALALRRFDNIKSSPAQAAEIAEKWKHATHPNIIQLHGAWVHQRAL